MMKSWTPCFQREPHRIVGITILLCSLTFGMPSVFADEYFTEVEIDEIRAAQEIDKRVSLLLEIAQVRLVHLGLIEAEVSIEETPISTVDRNRHSDPQSRGGERNRGDRGGERPPRERTFPIQQDRVTPGYYQALEETMDNIDDAYERNRVDIRKPLESLKVFTEETIPLLRRFEAANEAEKTASGRCDHAGRTGFGRRSERPRNCPEDPRSGSRSERTRVHLPKDSPRT